MSSTTSGSLYAEVQASGDVSQAVENVPLAPNWFRWAPIPVRLLIGLFLAYTGFQMLFVSAARESAIITLTQLGIPMANLVIFGVAAIPLLAGIGLVLGLWVKICAWLVFFSFGAHLFFAFAQGGFPPAQQVPIVPNMPAHILVMASMFTILISGAGALSLNEMRLGATKAPAFRDAALAEALRVIPGLYMMILGTITVMTVEGQLATIEVLKAIGIPMAEIVWIGVGSIAAVGGAMMVLGFFPWVGQILLIFSVGSHALFAAMSGGFPANSFPVPGMEVSIILLGLLLGGLIANLGLYIEKRKVRMNLLNLMAPIKTGEVEKVRAILDEIHADLAGNPYIRFPESELTHFARFIITRHPEGPRLGMGATYNGDLKDYTEELLKIGPKLEELWGRCEGWTGRDKFYDFARKNSYASGMVFFGLPNISVKQVRSWIALHEKIDQMLGRYPENITDLVNTVTTTRIKPSFVGHWSETKHTWLFDSLERVRAVVMPPIQEFARLIGSIDIEKDWSRITTNYDGDIEKRKRELAQILELENYENTYAQTTMTVIADMKPGRTFMVRFLFLIGPPILKFGWKLGNFAGVYSLHSFRFALIDGGKRVWFMSNYNGSAENYFSDFIDKLNWGINAAYTHCTDYPKGGMGQQDAFAYWIRVRQLPALVYYSAYPGEGIHKLLRDNEIAELVGTSFDRKKIDRLLELV